MWKKINERFSKTHFIKVIKGEKRTINDLPNEIKFIKLFASESRVVNLMNEVDHTLELDFFNPLKNLNDNWISCIPTYNDKLTNLLRVTESILNQTVPFKRITIIDDGSRMIYTFKAFTEYLFIKNGK